MDITDQASQFRKIGNIKRAKYLTFRYSFAHLLEDGYEIRKVIELLGHRDVKRVVIYTHVLKRGVKGVRSLADCLYRRSSIGSLCRIYKPSDKVCI